jgi:hypothetical protein
MGAGLGGSIEMNPDNERDLPGWSPPERLHRYQIEIMVLVGEGLSVAKSLKSSGRNPGPFWELLIGLEASEELSRFVVRRLLTIWSTP